MYEDIGDFCRSGFGYFLLLTVPILFLCSNSVMANEFNVQRLSQFDINSVSFGEFHCNQRTFQFNSLMGSSKLFQVNETN